MAEPNSVWRTNSLRQDRPDAGTDSRNHITLLMSYSCTEGPALPGTTHSGSPRCLQRWQSSRCGYKGLSCACSWNLPACWCWSKSPGSGLFWAQVIYCGISSRFRNTPVEQDHAPRPPSARRIAGALIYACGDSRFSVHLHSSAARLLGSPWPRQCDRYYKPIISGGKIKVHVHSSSIHCNYIARPPRVHSEVSSMCAKAQDGKISQSMFWIWSHPVNPAAAGGSAHRACTACTAARPAAQPSPARSGPTTVQFSCARTSPPPVWGCPQSVYTHHRQGRRNKGATSCNDFQNKTPFRIEEGSLSISLSYPARFHHSSWSATRVIGQPQPSHRYAVFPACSICTISSSGSPRFVQCLLTLRGENQNYLFKMWRSSTPKWLSQPGTVGSGQKPCSETQFFPFLLSLKTER